MLAPPVLLDGVDRAALPLVAALLEADDRRRPAGLGGPIRPGMMIPLEAVSDSESEDEECGECGGRGALSASGRASPPLDASGSFAPAGLASMSRSFSSSLATCSSLRPKEKRTLDRAEMPLNLIC